MKVPFNTSHFTSVVKYCEKLMSVILKFHIVAIHLLFMFPFAIPKSLWNWFGHWVSTTAEHILTALLTHYLTTQVMSNHFFSAIKGVSMASRSDYGSVKR